MSDMMLDAIEKFGVQLDREAQMRADCLAIAVKGLQAIADDRGSHSHELRERAMSALAAVAIKATT